MDNKIYKLTDQEFIDLVKSSLNISEVLFKLGYATEENSLGYSQIKQRMQELNLTEKDFQRLVIQYDLKMNELNRFRTVGECCEYLMNNNLVKIKVFQTCRNELLKNIDRPWNGYYFKIIE